MRYAIWYHVYNFKNVKNIHTKSNTPPWMFFTFFKLYKWYQITQRITNDPLLTGKDRWNNQLILYENFPSAKDK